MKTMRQVSYLKRLFTRSCLETSIALDRSPRFGPVIRTASRDRMHTQLHQLKRQMLRAALEVTPQAHRFKHLCGAANQAAELVWETRNPLLVFPCLFEEWIKTVQLTSSPAGPQVTPAPATAATPA